MDPMLVFSVLSAVAAGIWSVLTWREEQEKEREIKRDQVAALFVNSFIRSIEELQSRLYGILEEDDLAFYKKKYPDKLEYGSPFALETLYHICQYFGWKIRTYRYGPYTNDPRVIELITKIGDAFEDRRNFSEDAFFFTFEERVSLGKTVVQPLGDVTGVIPKFDSIPLFQFQEEMSDKLGKHTRMLQDRVRRTLAAIDQADQPEELEGADRLAVVQNLLVDLLTYLEDMEGFSVSPGKPKRARLRGMAAAALPALGTDATVVHQIPGRIRMIVPRLRTDEAYAPHLQSLLESVDNVNNIRVNVCAASVVISFSPEIPAREFARRLAKTIEIGFLAA